MQMECFALLVKYQGSYILRHIYYLISVCPINLLLGDCLLCSTSLVKLLKLPIKTAQNYFTLYFNGFLTVFDNLKNHLWAL